MPRFSVDTSSLVAAWLERYPPDAFPGFWTAFERAVEAGDIVASVEVIREVKRRDVELHKWCKAREGLAVEIDDACQQHVAAIMADYPKFVDDRTGKNSGDPFVIALAKIHNPPLVVITEEKGGSAKRPAIPFVCGAIGVRSDNILALIRHYGWKF